jgi:arylsulfatase A-like enzyme
MKHLISPLVALFLVPLAGLYASDAPIGKPNILVILADDLGYGDPQCYNPERGKIPTPNIDRLAKQGMRFTDGHSSSGVCSPSRYSLLTGRYHWRTPLQAGIVGLWRAPLIAADRLTIGGLAKRHGYRTAAIGKWHLGSDWPVTKEELILLRGPEKAHKGDDKDDEAPSEGSKAVPTKEHLAAWTSVFSKPIANGPSTRGFDTYFGTDVPNWPPYCFIENDHTVGIPSEFLTPKNLRNHLASKQGPALKDWKLEDILPTLGDRASAFLKDAATKPEPFLLYLPLTAPHTPLAVNPEWQGKSGLNTYADFVMETDSVIGRVLDALEASGAAEKTLVVFTSDNGCAPYIGASDLEKLGHYPSGPLRGYKADAWEGGHRVPFIVKWPGVVNPASQSDQLVQQSDLMATFAEILGTKLPSNVGEDSVSLLPILKGQEAPVRENAVNCSAGGVTSLRMGSWKYIAAPGSGGWGKGGDQSQPVQLYNLASDLGETKNLAAEQPERVAQMKEMLEKLIKDGRSTPGELQQNDVEVVRFPKEVAAKKEKAPFAK